MRRANADLWIAAGTALVCAAVTAAVPVTALRAVFAVPLCLVLPGYAITAATFGRHLSRLQTLLLTLALSLATLALGSLALDLGPGGIRQSSWTVLLVLVVLVACGLAAARREPGAVFHGPRRRLRVGRIDALLLIFAGLVAASALVLSRVPLSASNALGYTQLWMLSSGTGHAPAVSIGVTSAEKGTTSYRLVLAIGAGRSSVLEPQLTLKPGSGTQVNVVLHGISRRGAVVTARLYKVGSLGVYRQATALISAPSSTQASSTLSPHVTLSSG